jgi:hypothetical protein
MAGSGAALTAIGVGAGAGVGAVTTGAGVRAQEARRTTARSSLARMGET